MSRTRPPGPVGERILIVRLSALGDVMMTLPLARALREQRPRAEIHFAVQDELAPTLEGHPDLDRVVPIPVRQLRGLLRNPLRWPAFWDRLSRLEDSLRAGRYDWVLDAHGGFKSGLVTWLTDAPRRVGPAKGEGKEGNWLFMTDHPRRPPSVRRHRRDRALALLSVLGLSPEDRGQRAPDFPRDWAREALWEIPGDGPLVLMHPGTSPKAAFKRWPARRFGELARQLVDELGVRVAVVTGPGEEKLGVAVAANSDGAARHLPTPPGLRELGGLLAEADLFVGADTGPGHLAHALGTRVVTLYGPKDPALYGPRSAGLSVVHPVACQPCGLRRCTESRVLCMEDLTAGTVARACRLMVEGEVPPGLTGPGGVRVIQQR